MSSLLRSLGFAVCAFASAEEFLASPRLGDTSCLVADVQMPGMSGLDLQDELAARNRHLPIIFITAFPEERIRKRAESAGAIGFFGKPIDSGALIQCLTGAVKRA
jgi:FixJ family two-component response regulator